MLRRRRGDADDVSLAGANTSFQLHARVEPAKFVDLRTAAQLATAPVLAVAGNSPFFLGHPVRAATCASSCAPWPAA